jgi:hypothetical protein
LGAWRNDLTHAQVERLTNAHRGVMRSLGYL